MKSPNIMSITGRMPVIAAPTAIPVNPASEIGVSRTRWGPNSSTRPVRTLNGWPASAISSPKINTRGSRRISSASASRMACASVSSRVATASLLSSVDILIHLVGTGIGSGQRKLDRAIDLSLHFFLHLVEHRAVGLPLRQQPIAHDTNWIAIGFPLQFFLLRAIVFAADIADMMPVIAVSVRYQQRRASALPGTIHQPFGRCINRAYILPIHLFRWHSERRT